MPEQSNVAKLILGDVGVKAEGQKSISYSQYTVYKECPYRWQLTYKEGLYPFTSNINSVFGTALHKSLQEYLRRLYQVSVKSSEEMNFNEYLSDRMIETYKEERKDNGGKHFLQQEEFKEYYADGIEILEYLRRKRKVLFDYREWELVAIELPLYVQMLEEYNILFNGYIDLLLYNRSSKTFRIPDIKTSTKGWNDCAKKDETKMDQIRLYKHYLAKHYGIPVEDISGEYLIVKRKIPENTEWVIPRHQVHIPAQGSTKVKLAVQGVEDFVKAVFNPDGTYIEQAYPRIPGRSCKFCPYNSDPAMCSQKPGYDD